MKRDDDYIRGLLADFEAQKDWLILIPEHLGMTAEERKKQYHTMLLCDAGLVVSVGKGTYRMTSSGHDYLEAIKNDGVWAQTKETVAETGGNATIDIMKSLAIGYLKKTIEEKSGIKL